MKEKVIIVFEKLIEPRVQISKEKQRFSNSELWNLIVPIIIEQFLALLVGIADTLMISHAGEAAVSGVSLVNQLNNVFILVFSALASGGAIVASQYIGRGDKENGDLAASQLVMITTLTAIVMGCIVLMLGRNIFSLLFGQVESEVFSAGVTYLRISAYSFPFLAVYNGCAGLFRSMSRTKVLMKVSIIMNAINVFGNIIGVFVLRAGVEGVAYPSLISRVFAAVTMVYLALDENNQLCVRIRQIFKWDMSTIRRIFHIAVPNSIESALFQLSKVALSSIVAGFGTVQIAANGVAQSFWGMAALFCIAMGPVFITVVGQYMGANDVDGAVYYIKKLLRITYLGSIVWNLTFLMLTPVILMLYDLSEEAVRLVIIVVIIHNIFNALLCPAGFPLSNGLRAAGDVKFNMYSAIFSTVICRSALSVLLGIIWNMGIIGIALAMVGDWAIKTLLTYWRYQSGKWRTYKVI